MASNTAISVAKEPAESIVNSCNPDPPANQRINAQMVTGGMHYHPENGGALTRASTRRLSIDTTLQHPISRQSPSPSSDHQSPPTSDRQSSHPSSGPQSSPGPNTLANLHYDFRMITTFLNRLQQNHKSPLNPHDPGFSTLPTFPTSSDIRWSGFSAERKEELRPLNAMANLIVRDAEVVSVVCKRLQGPIIQFVVCVDREVCATQQPHSDQPLGSGTESQGDASAGDVVWSAAENSPDSYDSRKHCKVPNPQGWNPSVADQVTTKKVELLPLPNGLGDKLSTLVEYLLEKERSKQTLEEHAGMVLRMLRAQSGTLPGYVLAMSCKKLRRRMRHGHSGRMMLSLIGVDWAELVPLIRPGDVVSLDNKLLFRLQMWWKRFQGTPGPSRMGRTTSNLLAQSQLQPPELYTSPERGYNRLLNVRQYNGETSGDFHQVLCALLLEADQTIEDYCCDMKSVNKAKGHELANLQRQVTITLTKLETTFKALHAVVSSSAMKNHARVLKSLLAKRVPEDYKNEEADEEAELHNGFDEETGAGEGDAYNGEGRPVDGEEDVEFIEFIKTGDGTSAAKDNENPYLNWLRLIVLPLISINILQEGQHAPEQVSLHFLSIKSLGTTMPAWKPLLRARLDPHSSRPPAISISELSQLTMPPADGPHDTFNALFQDGRGLSVENNFGGALHCEASLASLVYLSIKSPELVGPEIQSMLDGVNAIGVSRRSCPACAKLLSLLKQEVPLIQPSSHRQIYACALPPWLPEKFVQDMVMEFWTDLAWQLPVLIIALRKQKTRPQVNAGASASSNLSQPLSDHDSVTSDPPENVEMDDSIYDESPEPVEIPDEAQ